MTPTIHLACGCVASARKLPENIPYCGIHRETTIVEAPDITGRTARCSYCATSRPSNPATMAFFRHQPEQLVDTFYCGCFGWD